MTIHVMRNSKICNYHQPNLKNKSKNKLSKQLEQEQNHRNGEYMEGYHREGDRRRMGDKVQGISINGRYKIDKRMLRMV